MCNKRGIRAWNNVFTSTMKCLNVMLEFGRQAKQNVVQNIMQCNKNERNCWIHEHNVWKLTHHVCSAMTGVILLIRSQRRFQTEVKVQSDCENVQIGIFHH